MTRNPKVIILGAGMSGISCALGLQENFNVLIFEKSKGVGGRLCAKKFSDGLFHLGAQYCTSETDQFTAFLKKNNAKKFLGSAYECSKNLTMPSEGYYVNPKGMHYLLKSEAKSLDITFNERAISVDDNKKKGLF